MSNNYNKYISSKFLKNHKFFLKKKTKWKRQFFKKKIKKIFCEKKLQRICTKKFYELINDNLKFES